MRTIALVLVCLAYAAHGRREQMASENLQDSAYEEREVSQKTGKTISSSHSLAELEESAANARAVVPTPLKALALLLVAPAAAFPLSTRAAAVNPRNNPAATLPGHNPSMNNPNGFRRPFRIATPSAVRMQQNDEIGEDFDEVKQNDDIGEEFNEDIPSDGTSGWSRRPPVPELQQERTVTPKEKRVPWDWRRFIQQSSRFVEPPSIFKKSEVTRVLTPGDSFGKLQLFPLDDVVMGGASASTFDNLNRKWAGKVTSSNSGGFVGIRAKTVSPLDLTATKGIVLKLRPDGEERRFKFVLRDSTDFNGITWTASFIVGSPEARAARIVSAAAGNGKDNGLEIVRIPYSALTPTIFAKTVPDVSIDLTNIVAMQLTLSKFEYDGELNPLFTEGDFELDVLDVATF